MPCGYETGIVGEALALKLHAPLGFYIQKIIYIGCVQLFFLVFPKSYRYRISKLMSFRSLAQMEWRVNRSNITIYIIDICIHFKL